MHRVIALFTCLFALTSCAPLETDTTRQITLVYSGNLDGELEPCGCSAEGDLGGIQRRATYIDQLSTENRAFVLISSGGLFKPEIDADQIKDRFITTGIASLPYDAIGLQWLDLSHGTALLTDAKLPVVASNWLGDEFAKQQTFTRGGQQISYFQWLDPQTSPYRSMQGETRRVGDDPTELTTMLRTAKAAQQLTIVGTTLTAPEAKALLPLDLIDVLLLKSRYELLGEPLFIGTTLILQPGSRGQRLGEAALTLRSGRIVAWKHKEVLLPSTVASAARLNAWYDAYNDALRVDYEARVAQRKLLDSGESPYVGDTVCAGCHKVAHDIWSQSKHANAYLVLENVGKAFDPNCIGCHTVGFNQQGGFLDMELTGHLSNVQCENCHGSGKRHAVSGGKTPTPVTRSEPAKICAQCHNHEHSPTFAFEKYWPNIVHGREPAQ